MFCTGGIRCEKASAYMLENGFPEVYHLEGGILKYLETVPPEESLWQGECFVFDERVALGHGVEIGTHSMCGACGYPIPKEGAACPSARRYRGYAPGKLRKSSLCAKFEVLGPDSRPTLKPNLTPIQRL